MIQDQNVFIDSIRKALGRSPEQDAETDLFTTSPSADEITLLGKVGERSQEEKQELVERLRQVAGPLHIDLHPERSLEKIAGAIGRLILEKDPEWGTEKCVVRWDHPLMDQLGLESLPELEGITIHTTTAIQLESDRVQLKEVKQDARKQVEASFIGITSADYCVAATATLAMRSRPGQPRSVSLVPSIHVAVVAEDKLLGTLEELYTLLKWDPEEQTQGLTNCLSLISGPSKTGDIELIMVHGAHGPRELHLFVVSQEEL